VNKKPFLCALALFLQMCTTSGTETDNPLVDFDASECKEGEALTRPSTIMRTAAALALEPDRYEGLYCVAWELAERGALKVDILNFSSGCHIAWEPGEISLTGDQLTLTARVGRCAVAGCGSCIYDLTFEVSAVDASRPLDMIFQEDNCHDVELGAELTLPLDERPEGIVCREARFYRDLEPICGTAHTPPCTDMDGPLTCEAGGCEGTLACVEGPESDDGDICLETCQSDEDCTLEIDSCQEGLCRLRETF